MQTKTQTFKSFADLGRALHQQDVAKAANLRKTQAARAANKARTQKKAARAVESFVNNPA